MSNPPVDGGGGDEGFWGAVASWLNAQVKDKNVPPMIARLMDENGNITPQALLGLPKDYRENVKREFEHRADPGAAFGAGWLVDPGEQGGGQGGGGAGGGQGGGGGGGNGGGAGGPGGGGGGGGDSHSHQINMAAQYGWSLAVLNMVPELKKLFQQAIKQHWSGARFQAEVQDTHWYKTHSSAMRKYEILKATDPAEWRRQLDAVKAQVRDTWGTIWGVAPDPETIAKISMQAMKFGFSAEELNDRIVEALHIQKAVRKDDLGGNAAQMMNQLRSYADQYGIRVSDKWIATHIENILHNNDTMDGALNDLRSLAKSKYRGYADEIDAGKTIEQIADPYRQAMSSLLEINPEGISIFNNKIQDALAGQKLKSGDHASIPLWQFEDKVRQDPRFLHTDQAKESFMDAGSQLLQSFGLMA